MLNSERMKYVYTLQYEMMDKFKEVEELPVILCVGSTRVPGDCLGPIVGHLLKNRYNVAAFVYGTPQKPVTATNVEETVKFIEAVHGSSSVIAIDAAVGEPASIGEIRVYDDGIYPGLATGKILSKVGTHSVIGIVEERSAICGELLLETKINFVTELAEVIACAVSDFLIMNRSKRMMLRSLTPPVKTAERIS